MKSSSMVFSSRRSVGRLIVVMTLAAAPVAPRPALADQSTNAQTSAQVRYRQAIEAFREKKWEAARRLLLQLWQESHTYDVAFTLGQTEYQLGHYAAAANYLQYVVANIPPTEKLGAAEEYGKNLASLQSRTARVKIATDQASAEIRIDGEVVGSSPLPSVVYVAPGPHRIEARLGERTVTQSIDVALGSLTAVELKLGTSPQSPLPVVPAPSPKPAVASGLEPPPANESSQPSQARTIALWSGVGVTAVAAGVGVIFALKGSAAGNRAEDARDHFPPGTCPSVASSSPCSEIESALSDRESANKVANISFVVAGVAAVATGTMFFVWPRRPTETAGHVQVVPIANRNTGGLLVNASF